MDFKSLFSLLGTYPETLFDPEKKICSGPSLLPWRRSDWLDFYFVGTWRHNTIHTSYDLRPIQKKVLSRPKNPTRSSFFALTPSVAVVLGAHWSIVVMRGK